MKVFDIAMELISNIAYFIYFIMMLISYGVLLVLVSVASVFISIQIITFICKLIGG